MMDTVPALEIAKLLYALYVIPDDKLYNARGYGFEFSV